MYRRHPHLSDYNLSETEVHVKTIDFSFLVLAIHLLRFVEIFVIAGTTIIKLMDSKSLFNFFSEGNDLAYAIFSVEKAAIDSSSFLMVIIIVKRAARIVAIGKINPSAVNKSHRYLEDSPRVATDMTYDFTNKRFY